MILLNNFNIIDTIEKITIADSFIKGKNKIGGGHGESKLYIGQVTDSHIMQFFDIAKQRGKEFRCFVLKKDLLKYLDDIKIEYLNPTQEYQNKIELPNIWNERFLKISTFDEILYFTLKDQNQLQPPRIYFNTTGKDKNYNIIREIALANISYLSCLKLQDKQNREIIYYFRIFADLSFLNFAKEEQQILDSINKNTSFNAQEKEKISSARIGQGKYREGLLSECPFCPITMVSDDRLLIASHIKPWRMSNDFEKTDPKNGFMLTPNIDFLFDRGFISFLDSKQMLLSPWISKLTYKNLGLVDSKVYPKLPTEDREKYLQFHREHIFKV
ncbi:MAG: HNH endonuclease [Helicobacter sp.]|nr:HNH endonuclease [Helicobacter sp.]